jgi:hypothetical protein
VGWKDVNPILLAQGREKYLGCSEEISELRVPVNGNIFTT